MSKSKCDIDQLANEVLLRLNAYKDVTTEAMISAVLKTSNEAVKQLQNAHPPGSGKYSSWDDYNKGWTASRDQKAKGKYKYDMVVHNKSKYRLTHLLENGHAIVAGGRTKGKTNKFEHISPVAQLCEDLLMDNIIHELERNT